MQQLPHGASSTRTTSNNQNRNRRQQQHSHPQQHRPADNSDTQQLRAAAAPAHTRAPVLTRELTILESLSRNWRTYLPSSISGSPPAPRRRPLSFGGVIGGSTYAPGLAPDEEEAQGSQGPHEEDGERIIWSAWDELVMPGAERQATRTRVLLLAYATGFQAWGAENLSSIQELLNLKTESLHTAGPILCAAVLPPPAEGVDEFEGARPLLGVLSPTHFTLYSLATHSVIKQIPFTSPSTIVARPAFIVISTTRPPALHILSASTLLTLHTLSLTTAPVFALSHRLLAYTSPAPMPASHTPGSPGPTFISRNRDSLSHSVMRVGGEMWSGVKAAVSTSASELADPDRGWGFSRSAPAASSLRGRWNENQGQGREDGDNAQDPSAGWIIVLDLQPLLAQQPPRQLSCFAPFPPKHSSIAYLAFSGPGATPMLSVAPRDGHSVSVFQIRPGARHTEGGTIMREGPEAEMPWHWYELRRGVTSAKVESVVWERSGRWAGVTTGRRTVHVFPTNAYGGKPDERSHLEGRVYSAAELQPLSTEIGPLTRLRPSSTPTPDINPLDPPPPLTFTFLPRAASLSLPPALLPHPSFSTASSPTPTRSARSSPPSHSPAPSQSGTRSAFQDMLLFDPTIGELALRRMALDWVTPSSESAPGSGYSMSLPIPIGVGGKRPDAGERQGELVGKESVVATWALKRGREWAEVMSTLGPLGSEKPVAAGKRSVQGQGKASTGDYLSHAELSTYSRSPAVLPRPIYLSHQFSFHALGEDYHALLRRSQLDFPCTKIEVRKEVEVSAYAGDAESDAFVHGSLNDLQHEHSTKSRDRRAARGSFDEPIASAMRSVLDYSGQSPPVLPMLPNGASMSVLDAIPIRTKHVAAGVNEGLGRIRREIGKVRSPILRPTRPEGWQVPLEFDEEDESTFLEGEADGEEHEGRSRDDSGSAASVSVSTPSSRSHAELSATSNDETPWDAWDDEAQAAVAEAETFDEISPTGFMDEEQAPIMAVMSRQPGKGNGKGGKGKGRR